MKWKVSGKVSTIPSVVEKKDMTWPTLKKTDTYKFVTMAHFVTHLNTDKLIFVRLMHKIYVNDIFVSGKYLKGHINVCHNGSFNKCVTSVSQVC